MSNSLFEMRCKKSVENFSTEIKVTGEKSLFFVRYSKTYSLTTVVVMQAVSVMVE